MLYANLLSLFHLRIVEFVHVAIDAVQVDILIIIGFQVLYRCEFAHRL